MCFFFFFFFFLFLFQHKCFRHTLELTQLGNSNGTPQPLHNTSADPKQKLCLLNNHVVVGREKKKIKHILFGAMNNAQILHKTNKIICASTSKNILNYVCDAHAIRYIIPCYIGLDKTGYQFNIFLIYPWKHMLWVLIRSASMRHF